MSLPHVILSFICGSIFYQSVFPSSFLLQAFPRLRFLLPPFPLDAGPPCVLPVMRVSHDREHTFLSAQEMHSQGCSVPHENVNSGLSWPLGRWPRGLSESSSLTSVFEGTPTASAQHSPDFQIPSCDDFVIPALMGSPGPPPPPSPPGFSRSGTAEQKRGRPPVLDPAVLLVLCSSLCESS